MKCDYPKLSDKNTKFFHDIVKRNARRNFISMVFKADGMVTTSIDQVAEEFTCFYKTLLGSSSSCHPIDLSILRSGPLVFDQQVASLIGVVTDQEIKAALFAIREDKSSGPDRYSSCFFKKSWHTVGDHFCQAIKEFFYSGSLLKQLNHKVIALVPKSPQL